MDIFFPFGALLEAGISFTAEPFFRSLLLAFLKSYAEKLKHNARIAVPEEFGRNMLGVLDETKTLKYGQVFVQYSKDISDQNSGTEILQGPVIVTKNPCLHPGDVRKFTAVKNKYVLNNKHLRLLKDCIVFPARGKRPHP
ncbi:RNA-dependent RNA polymerase 1, partial [Stegodyphus mimosarum]